MKIIFPPIIYWGHKTACKKMVHCAKSIFNPSKDFEKIEIFENFSYHTVQYGALNFGTSPNLKY